MPIQFVPVIVLLALLSGCGGNKDESSRSDVVSGTAEWPVAGKPQARLPATQELAIGEKVYKSSCSLCHRIGLSGAPRLGDGREWALRFAQGKEVLYDRAINGYRGSRGSMPSRGSNAKLSDSEVRAAVDYMVWYSVPASHDPLDSHMFPTISKQTTIR